MTLPADWIASLDAQIAENGESLTLRRNGATDRPLRGSVLGQTADALQGGGTTAQDMTRIIVSPTGLGAWGVPIEERDYVVLQGRECRVKKSLPKYIDDTLVRVTLTVKG